MSPLGRASHIAHERARTLAALALDEPLASADAAWLTDHLAGCAACREVAAAYSEQRLRLRSLPVPEPPRDLWARTSAALEREATRGGRPERRRASGPAGSPAVLGILAAACVVGVVVGSTLLASLGVAPPSPRAPGTPVSSPVLPVAGTPIPLAPGNVAWVARSNDGRYALNVALVDSVCPADAEQACAPLDGSARQVVALDTLPSSVVLSQQRHEAVVVGSGGTGGVYVVTLPASALPTPQASATPAASATASRTSSPAVATATATPATTSAAPSPTGSAAVAPTATPGASSAATASPSPAGVTSILDGVTVVGDTAAYSSDGQWFAFSARPADGSTGPDIYVWRVGDARARPVTADHASIFSAWLGDLVLGSSAGPAPAAEASASASPADGPSTGPSASPLASGSAARSTRPAATSSHQPSAASTAALPSYPPLPSAVSTPLPSPSAVAQPHSFVLDPATGAQQQLAGLVWRPVVDPSGTYVVFWSGTLRYDALAGWRPDQGDLYLAAWSSISQLAAGGPALLPPPTAPLGSGALPSAAPSGGQTGAGWPAGSGPFPTASAATQPVPQLLEPDRAGAAAPTEWDVRWDAAGEHIASWLADAVDPTVGRLSLFTLDRSTGLLDPSHQLLADAPALGGYSIAEDHLAWATPPGQDGEGSHVLVLGWHGDDAGKIRTLPLTGTDAVVVVR
ncbi:MAG TPA: zf-HC2 domain-containing protein [Candidatus Limnocylindrales bacterium]